MKISYNYKKNRHNYKKYTFEIEKLMTFTKQESYDGGPKSFKTLAYKLEKQMKKAHNTNLKPEEAKIITDKDQIVEEFASYYKKLYRAEASADREQIQAYLRKLELPKVTQVNNEKLTKPIMAQEVHKQIQGLKMGKMGNLQVTTVLPMNFTKFLKID